MKSNWQILYAIVSLTVCVAILFGQTTLYLAAKPFLMITLLLYFVSASKGYPEWRNMVMLALVFSWGGDVLLIWNDLFLVGLGSFLIAHIFYIIAYQKTGAAQGTLTRIDVAKLGIIGAVMIGILLPHLGSLLIPVVVYTMVLLLMGLWAHKRRGATSSLSFRLVSSGALLFVFSDAVIAINRFVVELHAERILVMSTYIVAQYLIVHGLLQHDKNVSS